MLHQTSFDALLCKGIAEGFVPSDGQIRRKVLRESKPLSERTIAFPDQKFFADQCLRPQDLFYQAWLRKDAQSLSHSNGLTINIADLFSGCGGMSLGIAEAALASGCDVRHVFAAEHDQKIAEVYGHNLRPENLHIGDIAKAFNGAFGQPPTANEKELIDKVGHLDLLCGGPPCQGHSDLNNYTRRNDPRNSLYFLMARAAELLRPNAVIIENVPGVRRDRTGNFGATIRSLEELGYSVAIRTVNAKDYGVPQSRKRTFVFAANGADRVRRWEANLDGLVDQRARTPLWAIEDLVDLEPQRSFDEASTLSEESQARVDWLFENSKYELDNSMRPDCHKLKSHSYNSVYGRMRPDTPAPTMTTGFLVMGQGRFIHPTCRRTITPHEGARIQTFPDFFDFGVQKRGMFARMIGNAVPPLLAYYVGLASLDAILH
ncbi:DNA cytosine methyltransferase [Roseovarius sp. S1116L3]|uniref:DNA cytosine methyltransferase n=1 Tax=Roseovarius roseus TaxID=3342636 RepID=UPI003727DF64